MTNDTIQQSQVLFSFACLAQKSGRISLAKNAWHKYVVVRPEDPRGHHNLGVCLDALGQEPASALASFESAFALQPVIADAGANAAGLLIRAGEAERASALCYRALKEDPRCSAALYNLNTALRMTGRQNEAVAFSWRWVLERLPSMDMRDTFVTFSAAACGGATAGISAAVTAAATAAAAPPDTADGSISSLCDSTCSTTGVPSATSATSTTGGSFDCTACSIGRSASSAAKTAQEAYDGAGMNNVNPVDAPGRSSNKQLTVACVRWGDKYGVEYVERLASGVRRNLRRSFVFVCFTDGVESLHGVEGVEARPLGQRCLEWRGWWTKAYLFSREARLTGRVLYMDLDTVISGSLDDIAAFSGHFAALSAAGMANERRSTGTNSSVMSWDETGAGGALRLDAIYYLLEDAYAVVTACVHKFDHWLEMVVRNPPALQQEFPGQIVEYAADCCCSVDQPSTDPRSKTSKSVAPGHTPKLGEISGGFIGTDYVGIEGREVAMNHRHKNNGAGGVTRCVDELARTVPERVPRDKVPENARIICFPLEPKPHNVDAEWITRFWFGVEANDAGMA